MLGALHRTAAGGTTIAWMEVGEGPPLVLLHGLADSHRTWRFVAPLLAKRFRVLMVDLPGHGFSDRPDAPYTLSWYADTIGRWMDAVRLERAHFCGHSYGGGVAQWMLIDHRDRIERLALVASGGLGQEVGTALRLAALPLARPLLESPLYGPITALFTRWTLPAFARDDARELQRLARMNRAPRTGRAFRRTLTGCIGLRGQRVQMWDHISNISTLPQLALFWGSRDSIIPIQHAHDAIGRLANVTVTVYPSCGHLVHLEMPERLAEGVVSFLEDHTRAPAHLRSAFEEEDELKGLEEETEADELKGLEEETEADELKGLEERVGDCVRPLPASPERRWA